MLVIDSDVGTANLSFGGKELITDRDESVLLPRCFEITVCDLKDFIFSRQNPKHEIGKEALALSCDSLIKGPAPLDLHRIVLRYNLRHWVR